MQWHDAEYHSPPQLSGKTKNITVGLNCQENEKNRPRHECRDLTKNSEVIFIHPRCGPAAEARYLSMCLL